MDDEIDDIFNDKGEDNSEVKVEATPEAQTETVEAPAETTEAPKTEGEAEVKPEAEAPKEEQPRDDKGRFAQRDMVPLSALLAERQRAQAAAQERADFEAKLRELEARVSQSNRPDPYVDPDGYEAYLQAQVTRQVEARLHAEREEQHRQQVAAQAQNMFHNFATTVVQHDPEEVRAALDYAAARAAVGPEGEAWGNEALAQPDPILWINEQRNRHAQFEEYVRDPQGFLARKAAEMGFATAAPAAVAPQPQMATAAAPRSLASVGSATAAPPTATTLKEAIDAIFNTKG